MDAETKAEGNKLIAEFMETKVKPDGYFIKDYLYHSSWDWLMPVIDKIESVNGCSYKVMLQYAFAAITDTSLHGDPYVIRATGMTRIGTAYNLVIKFIKWYNQQTNK